ncbi:hypothetical protein AB6A40_009066 [Gnathostoma spinigerum]|uniref:Beta-lactamase-related domain-containing protein n=1 Tax=Gnathostoma spinigerum TaxID=75299 RepID=A0ABD6F035_9BILA
MPSLPVIIDGDCDSRFDPVKQAFRENFVHHWETEGAAFAVYLNGEKVIDLWGGYADSTSRRKWKHDTMTLLFSSTKSICAICFAVLVDRGLADYSDLVAKYWPEFGKNNKENITLEQLFSHQAGLAYVDGVIEEADIKDWTRMSKKFEEQTPNWPPGENVGYHALTIGWLFDQLVRRIDPKKRSLSMFFKEEIAVPYDIDIELEIPVEMEYRVARLAASNKTNTVREIVEYPIILKLFWNMVISQTSKTRILSKIQQNVSWMGPDFMTLNNPDIRSLNIPAGTGCGTARALAKLHSLLLNSDFIKPSTLEKLSVPVVVDTYDCVLTFPESKGKGFVFTRNINNQWMLGHPGMGGQNVKLDYTNKVAFAYLSNGMKNGMSDFTTTFMRLQKSLYECLNSLKLLKSPLMSSTQSLSRSSSKSASKSLSSSLPSSPVKSQGTKVSDTDSEAKVEAGESKQNDSGNNAAERVEAENH